MNRRIALAPAVLLAMLCTSAVAVRAHDESKYPNMRAQWTRIGSAQFDPSKPPGRGQEPPLTPEYQAILDNILAARAQGSLEGNMTVTCIPAGMPRAMIVYETMDVIVLPETTYIRMSYMNELRRVHTDGRAWPAKITPTFAGYSIGQWLDDDGDGRYDTLRIETRGFKGPRTFDGTPGIPLHKDNQTIVEERIYLGRSDPNVLHADIKVTDNALSRPWSVARKYQRVLKPHWAEYICNEGNQQILLGKENYMVSADGYLMPVKKGQAPPDLKNFNQSAR